MQILQTLNCFSGWILFKLNMFPSPHPIFLRTFPFCEPPPDHKIFIFFLTASFKILRAGHGEKLSNPSWEKILLAGVVIVNLIKEMLHQTKSADCVAMLKFVFLGQVASFLGEIVLRLCCRTTLQWLWLSHNIAMHWQRHNGSISNHPVVAQHWQNWLVKISDYTVCPTLPPI